MVYACDPITRRLNRGTAEFESGARHWYIAQMLIIDFVRTKAQLNYKFSGATGRDRTGSHLFK